MITNKFGYEKKSFELAQDMLAEIPKGAEAAAARAFNRALITGRAAAIKEVTKRYAIRAGDVRYTFRMKKATKSDLTAELSSSGSALPLRAFAHKPTTDTTGSKRKPIRVTIKTGSTHTFTTAFVWNRHIYKRVGDKRLPIENMSGPSVPSMLGNDNIVDEVQDIMLEAAEKRLEHELSRLTEGKK